MGKPRPARHIAPGNGVMEEEPDPEKVWGSQRALEGHQDGDAEMQVPPTEDHLALWCVFWVGQKKGLAEWDSEEERSWPSWGARVQVQTWREEKQGEGRWTEGKEERRRESKKGQDCQICHTLLSVGILRSD